MATAERERSAIGGCRTSGEEAGKGGGACPIVGGASAASRRESRRCGESYAIGGRSCRSRAGSGGVASDIPAILRERFDTT